MTGPADALRRDLRLRDLVLGHVLLVVGTSSFGPAARMGSGYLAIWLFGITVFHIPLAIVVAHLASKRPIEGGLYQWVKVAFNDTAGFLVAWNTWVFLLVLIATIGLTTAAGIGYFGGPAVASAATGPRGLVVISILFAMAITSMAVVGLRIAKWLHNAATVLFLGVVISLAFLPLIVSPKLAAPSPALPPISLLTLTLMAKTAVFALAGLEALAILAGETRDPGRNIRRSIIYSVPIIAGIYILGTRSILMYVPAAEVDLVNPLAQVFGSVSDLRILAAAPVAIAVVLVHDLAVSSQIFAVSSRLPMVAGWDHFLPSWFSRLHPRWRTPRNSIVFLGVVVAAIAAASVMSAGLQEAFQVLESTSGILFGVTYLALFAVPFSRRFGIAPVGVRAAALLGFTVTLAFVVLSVYPIVEVESAGAFAKKVGVTALIANLVGVGILVIGRRRSARPTDPEAKRI